MRGGLEFRASRQRKLVLRFDVLGKLFDRGERLLHCGGERRGAGVTERPLQASRCGADLVEVSRRGNAWRRSERALEIEGRCLGLVDARWVFRQPQSGQLLSKLLEVASADLFLRDFAQGSDRHRL